MASALPLLLFLGFLFVFVLLIVVTGYFSIAHQRGDPFHFQEHAGEDSSLQPRFLADLRSSPESPPPKGAEAEQIDVLVRQIEGFLEKEYQVAQSFAAEPSVMHLLGPREGSCRSWIGQVQRHLKHEHQLVDRFVSAPSVDRLFEQPHPPILVR